MSQATLGIHVSEDRLDAILLKEGKRRHYWVAKTIDGYSKLVGLLQKAEVEEVHVCLEPAGLHIAAVANFMFEQGYRISTVSAAEIDAYAAGKPRRRKHDKERARLVAEYCQKEQLALWSPPEEGLIELQEMVEHLVELRNMRQHERDERDSYESPTVLADIDEYVAYLSTLVDHMAQDIDLHVEQYPHLKEQHDLLAKVSGKG